uniref:Uncharacterized protein n=1 Tax=Ditylenchus dipsaci TaxID=166011 RepID=A0A915EM67_9BILA
MIPLISESPSTNVTFLVDFALKNEACMLDKGFSSTWKAIQMWVKSDGSPDLEYLVDNYGGSSVPILLADSSSDYKIMPLSEFVDKYLRNRLDVAYLKDWHFQRSILLVNSRCSCL